MNTSTRIGRSEALPTLPLISHASADAVVAYRSGAPIRAGQFLADVERLTALLPQSSHVLNVCADRYRFTVGLAASLLTRKVSLLPSTHTPEVIRQLASFAPDAFCLTDDPECAIALPRVQYPDDSAGRRGVVELRPERFTGNRLGQPRLGASSRLSGRGWPVPEIEASQLAAYVFTSGSTGTPVPFQKTWGRLVRCVRDEATRLGFADGRSHAIVATVPPQHMYGFESSVLVALQSGGAFCAERPFFPADVCSALAAAPRPRALVSTPVHLRALLAADVHLPSTDLVVSATAPLPEDLAREVERRFETRLLEIYGSTETGQIATRRTAQTREWQLWPAVTLTTKDGQTWAQGGHVEQPTPMCDVLEITREDRFLLHGRMADLVNIAGKRSSLAYLTHQLNSIPGVLDGAFFHPEESPTSSTGVERVAALVVAPGLDSARITDELRRRIDPVFLPRPLIFVDRLPRNGTGKLPREALLSVAAAHSKSSQA